MLMRPKRPKPTPLTLPPPNTVPMPSAEPAGFTRIQSHDFPGTVPIGSMGGYPARTGDWTAYPSGQPDTWGGGVQRPEKVLSIHDSYLDWFLHTEGGEHCIAAPRLWPGLDRMLYGRVALRLFAEQLPGYYAVPLWWPISEVWPRDGEIDFPEGALTSTIKAFMHRQGATTGGEQAAFDSGVYHGAWHTFVTEWTPNICRFVLDGTLIGSTTERIPNTVMRHVLQVETSPAGPPADATQGHIWLDWYTLAEWSG